MSIEQELRVEFISPPDREFLVAAIMAGTLQVAEVNVEKDGRLTVEVYPSQFGQPREFDLAEFQRVLNGAAIQLKERTGRG